MRIDDHDIAIIVTTVKDSQISGEPTGLDLIEAVQASRYRDIDLEVQRAPMPIKSVSFSDF